MLVKFFKLLRDPITLSKHTTVSKTKQSHLERVVHRLYFSTVLQL